MSVVEVARPVGAPSVADAVSAVLERAADLIERDGWCQDKAFDTDGRRCALGIRRSIALLRVRSIGDAGRSTRAVLRTVL